MGGMSSESEISKKTGGAIINALQEMGYNSVSIDVDNRVADTGDDSIFLQAGGTNNIVTANRLSVKLSLRYPISASSSFNTLIHVKDYL